MKREIDKALMERYISVIRGTLEYENILITHNYIDGSTLNWLLSHIEDNIDDNDEINWSGVWEDWEKSQTGAKP